MFRVAAVHACPVYFDRERTIDKACRLIAEAGQNGAALVVFPEAFVPGYPVWSFGDGSDLAVYQLPFGVMSGLLCWENYLPLARYALAAWGAQIHVAPTWDRGEPWTSTMRHVAKEGRPRGSRRSTCRTAPNGSTWAAA